MWVTEEIMAPGGLDLRPQLACSPGEGIPPHMHHGQSSGLEAAKYLCLHPHSWKYHFARADIQGNFVIYI